MIDDLEALAALLAGTPLEGATLSHRWSPEWRRAAVLVEPADADPLSAWRLLRDLLPRTGRYPVVSGHDEVDAWLSPAPCLPADAAPGAAAPEVTAWRARQMEQAQDFDLQGLHALCRFNTDLADTANLPPDHRLHALFLQETKHRFGVAPSLDDYRGAFAGRPAPRQDELEWWLWQWEIAHIGSAALQQAATRHCEWSLLVAQPVLVLTPAREMWRAAACLPFWSDLGWPWLYAALRSWQQRFGAELVLADRVQRWIQVARRPGTPREAMALAIEHCAVTSDTLVLPGVSLRDHARHLLNSDRWLVYHKP